MKKSMQKQYGKEEGKKVYFATIRKQAMEEEKHKDHEPEMIRNQFKTAKRASKRIKKHTLKKDNFKAWVQSKITKATDYLDTAADYLDGKDDMKEELNKKDKPYIKKLVKNLRKGSKTHAKQADKLEKAMNEESNPRIPRKKGQPANSKKHSDLYTDENPKGTIHGLGFKDVATAKASVAKIRKSNRSHAHKIQAAVAMEQRAREMGKTSEAAVYRKFINSMKKKTKKVIIMVDNVYLGNPNLKKANTPIEFSEENIIEFLKCKDDPVYFAKKYIKIVSLDEGLVPFDLYPFQEKLVKNFHENRFNICKMPRQTGKSTTVVSYLLHYAIFNDSINIGILANKAKIAMDLLGRLQTAYENLPKWMQQGIIAWNKGSLELDNGSKILAASTSASAVRGMSFNILFLDEFAFVPNHVADDFFASVYPTISSGTSTKVIIVSTPRGMNHFYRMWHDAERGTNGYIPTDVHWNEVPGRDEAWKAQTIANTSEQQFKVEFECEFLGSVNTLIAPSKLKKLNL